MNSNAELWHYTIGIHAHSILRCGHIRPATAFIADTEIPIVWFSAARFWENTANKIGENPRGELVALSRQQTEEHGGGLFRFSAPANLELMRWPHLGSKAGMTPALIRALTKSGRERGSRPENWCGVFGTVPIESSRMQMLVDGKVWTDFLKDEDEVRSVLKARGVSPMEITPDEESL